MGKRIPKKVSSYLAHFLKVLSKPQRKHFLVYLVGLIWIIKFRSIREIATTFGQRRTDVLQHFLTASVEKTLAVREESQRRVAESVASTGKALLILDDTPCPRNGKAIEGLGIHHGADGFVKGLCAVTAILKVGPKRFFWAIRGYRPKKSCPKGEFKSKVQLAIEILEEARRFFSPATLTVLMDAWYACAPVLNPIQGAGWTYLAAIKRNRIVGVDGRKTRVGHLAKGLARYKTIRVSKKKRFRVAKREAHLPRVGMVVLFVSQSPSGTRFFVTNNLEMTESEMVRLYSQRFWIDTFHREIKQYLGFGELFMRSWAGVQKHWTLVGVAYNLIVLWNGERSGSFRQTIRHFRDSVCHDSIIKLPMRLKLTS